MTLTLHGFAVSNYYNKVKMALLEKGVPFNEAYTPTRSTDPAVQAASPLRKIPYLMTPQGPLAESQVIVDWIEQAYPQPPLMPADPFQAAKVRELTTFIDWHLEMAARQVYGMVFFGGDRLSDGNLARIRAQITDMVGGLRQLVRFEPFVAGTEFTQADLSAFNNLPLVGLATKLAFGEDLLVAGGIDYKPYLQTVGERASAQKVAADRKAAQAAMAARPKT
jgi:glutathione S-transferase